MLSKRKIGLARIFKEVSDKLKKKWQLNYFGFLCYDNAQKIIYEKIVVILMIKVQIF